MCKIGAGQALSRSYGCFFAEFLGRHSLVRLGLLDLITCVGLRYGFHLFMLREFSWKLALSDSSGNPEFFAPLGSSPEDECFRIFLEANLMTKTQIQ